MSLSNRPPQCQGQPEGQCFGSVAVHDVKWDSQFAALLNLLRTAFICLAITAGTILFNRDAARLVLQPIDRMLKQVWASKEWSCGGTAGHSFTSTCCKVMPDSAKMLDTNVQKSIIAVSHVQIWPWVNVPVKCIDLFV